MIDVHLPGTWMNNFLRLEQFQKFVLEDMIFSTNHESSIHKTMIRSMTPWLVPCTFVCVRIVTLLQSNDLITDTPPSNFYRSVQSGHRAAETPARCVHTGANSGSDWNSRTSKQHYCLRPLNRKSKRVWKTASDSTEIMPEPSSTSHLPRKRKPCRSKISVCGRGGGNGYLHFIALVQLSHQCGSDSVEINRLIPKAFQFRSHARQYVETGILFWWKPFSFGRKLHGILLPFVEFALFQIGCWLLHIDHIRILN